MTARPWKRKLWGVMFDFDTLISDAWEVSSDSYVRSHDGEPVRALLFTKRAEARAWIKPKNAEQAARNDWWGKKRYRVVRVVETVRLA